MTTTTIRQMVIHTALLTLVFQSGFGVSAGANELPIVHLQLIRTAAADSSAARREETIRMKIRNPIPGRVTIHEYQ